MIRMLILLALIILLLDIVFNDAVLINRLSITSGEVKTYVRIGAAAIALWLTYLFAGVFIEYIKIIKIEKDNKENHRKKKENEWGSKTRKSK